MHDNSPGRSPIDWLLGMATGTVMDWSAFQSGPCHGHDSLAMTAMPPLQKLSTGEAANFSPLPTDPVTSVAVGRLLPPPKASKRFPAWYKYCPTGYGKEAAKKYHARVQGVSHGAGAWPGVLHAAIALRNTASNVNVGSVGAMGRAATGAGAWARNRSSRQWGGRCTAPLDTCAACTIIAPCPGRCQLQRT